MQKYAETFGNNFIYSTKPQWFHVLAENLELSISIMYILKIVLVGIEHFVDNIWCNTKSRRAYDYKIRIYVNNQEIFPHANILNNFENDFEPPGNLYFLWQFYVDNPGNFILKIYE